jgi:hypothetical protein
VRIKGSPSSSHNQPCQVVLIVKTWSSFENCPILVFTFIGRVLKFSGPNYCRFMSTKLTNHKWITSESYNQGWVILDFYEEPFLPLDGSWLLWRTFSFDSCNLGLTQMKTKIWLWIQYFKEIYSDFGSITGSQKKSDSVLSFY